MRKKSLKKIKKLYERTCFFNFSFFNRQSGCDWLKPFVLIYDHFAFEDQFTLTAGNGLTYRYPEVINFLRDRAIFLDEYEGFLPRNQLNQWALENLRPLLLTKTGKYNKAFLKPFTRRMSYREGGYSDWQMHFSFKKELAIDPEDLDARTDGIIMDEFLDAHLSATVFSITGIPSCLDELGAWLFMRSFKRVFPVGTKDRSFRNFLLDEIPALENLPWKDILELRKSRHRPAFLKLFRRLPVENSAQLQESTRDSLWRLATEVASETNLRETALKGVGSNIPGLLINPISLA